MIKRSNTASVAFGLILFSVTGCRKEADQARWDVDVAVPLISTSLDISDLIPDSLLTTDGDGQVVLLYETRLFDLELDTILQAPDTSFRYKYPPFDLGSATLDVFPGTSFEAVDEVTRFDLDEFELRELHVRSGMVDLILTNRLGTTILSDFQLPGARLNGVPLASSPTVLPGSAAFPTVVQQNIPLDGYRFDLRGPDFTDVNTLATVLNLRTDPNGPVVVMSNADSVEAVIGYRQIVPQYARGYFGTRTITIDPDTSELDLFNDISGLIDLDGATARLRVRNGIGVDARARINQLRSVNRNTMGTVDLLHAITTNAINLDRALDLGGSFQSAENLYTINSENSNIEAFIENLPTGIAYDMSVTIDPLGDVSNGNDFFYYESSITADLEVEIPLRLSAQELALSTTTDVELEGTLENHAVRSGTLHVFATNGFPFSARLEMDLVNAEGTVLATLSPGGTIAAAQTNGTGVAISATESQVGFALNEDQVDLIYPGSLAGAAGASVRIRVVFNTADAPSPVQLRADQTIDVVVTFEGTYMVNGDE